MNLLTKISGAWKQVKRIKVKQAGVWKNVRKVFVKVAGAWKLSYVAGQVVPFLTYNYQADAQNPGYTAIAQARVTPSVKSDQDIGWFTELQQQVVLNFPVTQTASWMHTLIFDDTKPLPILANNIRVTNLVTGIAVVLAQNGPMSRFWQYNHINSAGGYPPNPLEGWVRNGVNDPFLIEYLP